MGRLGAALVDLTVADLVWGGGPLLVGVLAGVKALRTTDPTHRAVWLIVAAGMLLFCVVYAVVHAVALRGRRPGGRRGRPARPG